VNAPNPIVAEQTIQITPISGTMATKRDHTIHMSKLAIRTSFEPKLQFLKTFIHINNGLTVNTQALVDSGCAKTAMSTTLFNKICELNSSIKLTQQNIKIQTVDGTKHNIKGTVHLTITFDEDKTIPISIEILVIDALTDPLLIGADILTSSLVEKITPLSIFLKDGKRRSIIPFVTKNLPSLKVTPECHLRIPPKSSVIYAQDLVGFDKRTQSLKLSYTDSRIKINSTNIDYDKIYFELFNPSTKECCLAPRVPIIRMTKISQALDPSSDEYMDEEEQNQAKIDFYNNKFHQPSITHYIESRNMVTEADKIDIPTITTPEQFLDLFDFSNLTHGQRDSISKIMLEMKQVFALHKYDLGKCNVLEMDIELTTSESKIQKYIPIPMNVKDRANEILDQMERFDIIRECHEPSPFCSNILVIPKKDKVNVRLLFDGRLLNYDTKRLPISFLSKPEILSHLMKKTHLTSLDFADAFYQIPLSKSAQPYTAFWTPNQGKRMCFTRAPQGLRNSPLYLKMALEKIFYDMDKDVLFYVDDLLIATEGNIEDHFATIKEVLFRLAKANMKLRPQKLLIAKDTIEFLGMIFSKNEINIPNAKLLAFQNLPIPNTAKRLKSAICAFSYYRTFIPNFAHVTRELTDMSNTNPKDFKVTPEYETKFKEIISHICANAKTYHPDANKPFYVQTDASMYCAGGRLYQKDNEGNELLIAAVSRTFTKTERNYTIYKKEALSLLYTLRSMDFYIQHAPKLIILVDSKALTYIRLAKESQGILLRFSLELSKYEADIIHVPGEQNEISDLLSRQHKNIPAIEASIQSKRTISEKDTIKIIDALTVPEKLTLTKSQFFNLMNGPSPVDEENKKPANKSKAKEGIRNIKNSPITLNNRKIKMPRTTKSNSRPGVILKAKAMTTRGSLKRKSDTDTPNDAKRPMEQPPSLPEARLPAPQVSETPIIENDNSETDLLSYSDVATQIAITQKGFLTKKDFLLAQLKDPFILRQLTNKNSHIIKHDELYYHKLENNEKKIMLPEALLNILIHTNHYTGPGIHKTRVQIERDISSIYFIPQKILTKAIKCQISDCYICQLYSNDKNNDQIATLTRTVTPRLSWSIDLITDLPLSKENFKLLLICVDDFSNFIIGIPLRQATSKEIIYAIKNHIIVPFGPPKFIRSDEQPGIYNSTEFFEFMTEYQIDLHATAVASPFSNGRAERTIQIFKKAAKKYFFQTKTLDIWDQTFQIVVSAINKSINSFNHSPEEIMFGYKSTETNPLIDLSFTNNLMNEKEIDLIIERANIIRTHYDANKKLKENANLTFKNKNVQKKEFVVGQTVLHRQLQVSTGTASKWSPVFTGPYVIEQIDNADKTAICRHLTSQKMIKAHFTNLSLYTHSQNSSRMPNDSSPLFI